MEESRIAEIRRFFDGEQKKLNRDKEAREKAGIVFNSLNALVDGEGMGEYEIPDERSNPEEMVVQNLAEEANTVGHRDERMLRVYWQSPISENQLKKGRRQAQPD
ncbi:MAG: hypothetical protein EOM40_17860 [Clostridia bacterium]|nr:hypothetical protein [Clostridia bacterium]